MSGSVKRRQLLRWTGWFAAINVVLFALVGLRYLLIYRFPADLAGQIYAPLAFLGQMTLLAAVPLLLLLMPLCLLWPRRGLIMSLGVLIASTGLSLLVLDTQVFAQNRFHLSLLTVSLFEWTTWVFVGVMLLILVVFQAMLAGIVWRNFAIWPGSRRGGWVATILVLVWLGSAGLHIWGDAVAHTPVTQFTRFLPLYYPISAKGDLARLGWVDPDEVQRQRQLRGSLEADVGQLKYPLQPLNCVAPEKPLNVVMILIDALRPDAIHPDLTPHLARFRDNSLEFANHFSGGNSSRMGFFSMFYGLPTTYWQSFYDLQRRPVLMEELDRQGYSLALHSATGFGRPTLADRTVFSNIPDLPGAGQYGNAQVTANWLQQLADAPPAQPFFALLVYDPPIATMPADSDARLPMEERFQANPDAKAAWRRYRLAMAAVDEDVGRVMADLENRGMLDNTVVLITSDHGYEFDDNGLGYIGHASSFSDAQLLSTLLMHWPGKAPARIDARTSHHGLPVTLMQDLLGCTNDAGDFSVGTNLFSGESWEWIMAGSYSAHAIVQPDQVIVSHPGGFVEILDQNYQPLGRGALNADLVRESMAAMSRYFQ
ncbi:MAG: DUF3413 domain-containing protein [Gammaproteobacteria bacterium]|nr:DUF3413 domain-containing protein [Gammaproteobacteria bacterium]